MRMKIKRLEVEGYKSLKHVVWEPGDLNVLIGPNGSGKSNLLRLLEMLSASAGGKLDEFISNEGGIVPLLWDTKAKKIGAKFNFTSPNKIQSGGVLEFFYELDLVPKPQWNRYVIESELIEQNRGIKGKADLDKILLEVDKDKIKYLDNEGKVKKSQLMTGSETALGQIHDKSRLHENLLNIAAFLSDSTFFLNPNTSFGSELRLPQVTRYENKLMGDGQNLVNYLHTVYSENRDLREKVVTGMQAGFGNAFEEIIFAPAADQYIQMRIKWKHLTWQQPASALSDGILNYLFIVAVFADTESHSLIAIDEPEIGLHPALFPIIAEYADEASEHTQVVISTHSPDFLNALQEVNPKTTVTVFDWVDGETELRTLSGEKLDYWLSEYKLGEMFRSGGLEAI